MSKALFVTGTGTDVGKTYVTALLVKALHGAGKNAAYYKAAMSGNEADASGALIPGDARFVQKTAGLSQPLNTMCPYVYKAAVSPHLAARQEGHPVEMAVVKEGFQRVCAAHDYVTVEGSGGILCPLRWDEEKLWLEDVIRTLHHQKHGADRLLYAKQESAPQGADLQRLSPRQCHGRGQHCHVR